MVLVDRVYSCSMSPYDDRYVLYRQCKVQCFYIKVATMSFFGVLGWLACASGIAISDLTVSPIS